MTFDDDEDEDEEGDEALDAVEIDVENGLAG